MPNGTTRFSLKDVQEEEIEIPTGSLLSRSAPKPVVPVTTPQPEQGSAVQAPMPIVPAPQSAPIASEAAPQAPTSIATRTPRRSARQVEEQESPAMDLAMTQFPIEEEKIKTSLSIYKSIDTKLNELVFEMKSKGHRGFTRESVVNDALKAYFNMKH
jgi:hypothetical protein